MPNKVVVGSGQNKNLLWECDHWTKVRLRRDNMHNSCIWSDWRVSQLPLDLLLSQTLIQADPLKSVAKRSKNGGIRRWSKIEWNYNGKTIVYVSIASILHWLFIFPGTFWNRGYFHFERFGLVQTIITWIFHWYLRNPIKSLLSDLEICFVSNFCLDLAIDNVISNRSHIFVKFLQARDGSLLSIPIDENLHSADRIAFKNKKGCQMDILKRNSRSEFHGVRPSKYSSD